ncbi:MAG: hypothetical protein AAF787_15445 [Chloroflexota bacterium]
MRKVWIACGFVLGGLFVWSLTHEAREMLRKRKERNRRLAPIAAHYQRELEMQSAIDGVDYTSDEYWEQELAQYQDTYDKWERGEFDDQ